MTDIYCDEAGNSGQNLLDPEQPVFVLASTDFSHAEADEILEVVRSRQGGEPKFKTLKKTPDGVRRLTALFSDPRLNKDRVVITAMHKRFMVVTKVVDIIAETLAHSIGEDLYKQGANIALSNMLHYCMPVYCGHDQTAQFLGRFVDLVRHRTSLHVDAFFQAGDALVAATSDQELADTLRPLANRDLFPLWRDGLIDHALDPAIPALFQHIAVWGMRKPDRFRVIHDQSKPILATQEHFERMMLMGNESAVLVGYDRRRFKFPLQATALEQGDSVAYPQIQVADLCAGGIAHMLKCREAGTFDELGSIVRSLALDWVVDAVIPTTDVTPEELGTDSDTGTNPVDPVVELLSRRKAREK